MALRLVPKPATNAPNGEKRAIGTVAIHKAGCANKKAVCHAHRTNLNGKQRILHFELTG